MNLVGTGVVAQISDTQVATGTRRALLELWVSYGYTSFNDIMGLP